MLKTRMLIAALVAALGVAFGAGAAEPKAGDDKPAAEAVKKEAPKKKSTRHDHSEANKQGATVAEPGVPTAEAEKPVHDHSKFHK